MVYGKFLTEGSGLAPHTGQPVPTRFQVVSLLQEFTLQRVSSVFEPGCAYRHIIALIGIYHKSNFSQEFELCLRLYLKTKADH